MTHLLKLMALNRANHARKFELKAESNEATLYLYDMIVSSEMEAEFWGGVSPQAFAKALAQISAPVLHLRINSPGGDVFAAQAMAQLLREHPAQLIVHVDGYAASAATELAILGEEIIMAQGAMFMIHNAWTLAIGDKNDLLSTAALLEKVDGTLAAAYAVKTGADLQQVVDWMDAETWFTAQEAVDANFATKIADEKVKAKTSWDLSAYAHAPSPTASTDDSSNTDNPAVIYLSEDHRARQQQRLKVAARTGIR